MSAFVAVRKDRLEALARAAHTNFPIGAGGQIGQVLNAIYASAEASFDLESLTARDADGALVEWAAST